MCVYMCVCVCVCVYVCMDPVCVPVFVCVLAQNMHACILLHMYCACVHVNYSTHLKLVLNMCAIYPQPSVGILEYVYLQQTEYVIYAQSW